MPFVKGQSGNPAGRPPNARNKATIAMEQLLEGESLHITRMMIDRAKAGDPMALRHCMDRILPKPRTRPVEFRLPRIETMEDAVRASAEITEAIGVGYLTPGEAVDLLKVVEGITRTLKLGEITERLNQVEGRLAAMSGKPQEPDSQKAA